MSKIKLCSHCKSSVLIFGEELHHNACLTCLYGKPGVEDADDVSRDALHKPHEVITSLVIPPKHHAQMQMYCNLAKGEISGLAEVKVDALGVATIIQVALLPQECTSASTDISEESLHKFTYALARRGRDLSNWRVWWHTHHNFDCFWSQTDEDCIKRLSKFFNGYLLSVVLNQKGSILARLDDKRTQYDLELCIKGNTVNPKLRQKCARQIKRMVKEAPLLSSYGNRIVYIYE